MNKTLLVSLLLAILFTSRVHAQELIPGDGFCSYDSDDFAGAGETYAVSSYSGKFFALATDEGPTETPNYDDRTTVELFLRKDDSYQLKYKGVRIFNLPTDEFEMHLSDDGILVVGPTLQASGFMHTIRVYSPDGELKSEIDHLEVDYSKYDSDCLDAKPWVCTSLPFRLYGDNILQFYDLDGVIVYLDLETGSVERPNRIPYVSCPKTPNKKKSHSSSDMER